MDLALIAALTLFASSIGTLTGFGTSTIMVPVMVSFFPLSQSLFFVGIIHWFGDIWKIGLFKGPPMLAVQVAGVVRPELAGSR